MVTIHLEPTGESYALPREFILERLPNSLLANALESDPTATEIRIPNPAVTPEAMEFLVNIAQGIEPANHIPNLFDANDYLNIPWLTYYTIEEYDDLNRNDLNDPANRPAIETIIDEGQTDTYAYMLTKGYQPHYDDLIVATMRNNAPLQALINQRVKFPPYPDRRDMIKKIRNAIIYVEAPTDFDTLWDIRQRANKVTHLAQMEQLFANGDYRAAYDLYDTLRDRGQEEIIPKDVRDILTYLYNRESQPPSAYYGLFGLTRWIPPTTDEFTAYINRRDDPR